MALSTREQDVIVVGILAELERRHNPVSSIRALSGATVYIAGTWGPAREVGLSADLIRQSLKRLRHQGKVVGVGYGSGTRYYLSEAEAIRLGLDPRLSGEHVAIQLRYGRKYLDDGVLAPRVLDALIRLSRSDPAKRHTLEDIQLELAQAWHETYDVLAIARVLAKHLKQSVEMVDTRRNPGYRLSQRGCQLWADKPTPAPFL